MATHSSKRNLDIAPDLCEVTDIESGSTRRQYIQTATSSGSGHRCGSGLYPRDFALSINHILEEILGSLDRNSLLKSRLVSHRWRSATSAVMKEKDIRISFIYRREDGVYACGGNSTKGSYELKDLITFLKKYYTKGKPSTMDAFPCNKFEFYNGSLNNAHFQSFLNTYGQFIRNLHLNYSVYPQRITESAMIKKLEHVLCVQAPNMEFLNFFAHVKYKKGFVPELEDTRPNQNQQRNVKLHTLKTRAISRKILDSIISISPNLRQINIDCCNMHLLINPVDRLQFLRQFRIEGNENNGFRYAHFETIEAVISSIFTSLADRHRQRRNLHPIKITVLKIDFAFFIDRDFDVSRVSDLKRCLVKVINEILESSGDTLKSITFENHTADTLVGVNWPRVLPKVGHLTLFPQESCGLEIFPLDENFKVQETFPNISSIYFNVAFGNIRNSSPGEFSRKCNLGPVLSVTHVGVTVLLEQGQANPHVAGVAVHIRDYYSDSLLSKLFPNVLPVLHFKHPS